MFLVMDPVGNVPAFLALLQGIEHPRRTWVIFRESLFALLTLVLFLFAGPSVLKLLNISEPSLSISGGIILFLIAIRMIFPPQGGIFGEQTKGEPFIVPLAIPFFAGPSALTTVMLLTTQFPGRTEAHLAALFIAWAATTAILLLSGFLKAILGERGLTACERLMGLVLTPVAVQMFLDGIVKFLAK